MEPKEATIYVGEQLLSEAQSLTVRVALQAFALTLTENLSTEPGKALANNYLRLVGEINQLLQDAGLQ